jgi:hypothetical protein
MYEERLGLPVLQSLACGGDGRWPDFATTCESHFVREWEELSHALVSAILGRLEPARERQSALIRTFSEEEFNRHVTSIWGRAKDRYTLLAGW